MSGHGLFGLHPSFRSGSGSDEDSPPRERATGNRSSVKRALFGPTDHEENLRFVRNELQKSARVANDRWNFDFERECPLKGRFVWEPPKPEDVQEVYKLNRLPYLSTHGEEAAQDRSEKENRVSPNTTTAEEGLLGSEADLVTPAHGAGPPTPPPSSAPPTAATPTSTAPPTMAVASASGATESGDRSVTGARSKKKEDQRKVSDFLKTRKTRPKSKGRLKVQDSKTDTSSREASPAVGE